MEARSLNISSRLGGMRAMEGCAPSGVLVLTLALRGSESEAATLEMEVECLTLNSVAGGDTCCGDCWWSKRRRCS